MSSNVIRSKVPDVSDITEYANQCVRDGIERAEREFESPTITVFMHPDVHDDIFDFSHGKRITSIDGCNVVVSEYATLRVVVFAGSEGETFNCET